MLIESGFYICVIIYLRLKDHGNVHTDPIENEWSFRLKVNPAQKMEGRLLMQILVGREYSTTIPSRER